ncbi:hypothetical protein glysoja_004741 [Glycine soja]|nr:hypothetical protein glysoja_004741 [Glycine soja]
MFILRIRTEVGLKKQIEPAGTALCWITGMLDTRLCCRG